MKKVLKDAFYEASEEEIKQILECIGDPEPADKIDIERIKEKAKRQCGIVKKKKFPSRRWFAAAVYVCLFAVVAVVGIKYIDFFNTSSVVGGTSDDGSTASENASSCESIPDESINESQNVLSVDTSAAEEIEIKNINWVPPLIDIAGRVRPYDNLVKDILDNKKRNTSEPAWATVILESLTPIVTTKTEDDCVYYYSIAEIKIIDFHYYGKDLKDVAKNGDTIKIIVPYIVNEDGTVNPYDNNDDASEPLITYFFPMTEVGKKYVVAFYEYASSEKLELMLDTKPNLYGDFQIAKKREELIKEKYPELTDLMLGMLTSYPMFSMDIAETKSLSEILFEPGWVQMYVATYDRYMKEKVSEDSSETKFYNCFKDLVYNIFGLTPEKPTDDA